MVVYTWSTDRALRDASLRLGVSGYLSKRMSASDLVNALDMVHKGEVVVSEEPDRLPLIGGDWPGREEGLTARESEVLCLITQGLTNAQIVERTHLSINSIKSYIRSCYRKINVDSRSRAVLWGVDHGMQLDRVRVLDPTSPAPGRELRLPIRTTYASGSSTRRGVVAHRPGRCRSRTAPGCRRR